MTTMIRKCRVPIAALILTAVLMSFPTATSAAIRWDPARAASTRVCPIDWRQGAWYVKKLIRCAASYYGISPRTAIYVAWRESRFRPTAYNAAGNAAGIYQHLVKYWPERATDFGFRDWSVFNARANVMVTMRMVHRLGWAAWGG